MGGTDMKKLGIGLLCLSLMFTAIGGNAVYAIGASATYTYENENLGFSLTLPKAFEQDLGIEEYEYGVSFIYKPADTGDWGGLLFSIEVIAPRSCYLTQEYDPEQYEIIAMGKDCVYLRKNVVGGVDSGEEERAAYIAMGNVLTLDYLKENLEPKNPDALPQPNYNAHFSYLTGDGDEIRPDESLTRGEAAVMLYTLLVADNKAEHYAPSYSDTDDAACADAVGYLESYGIVTGYPDDTFRPDAPLTRAEFAVLLHRFLFTPVTGWYGDGMDFADISAVVGSHWAVSYVNSAWGMGWMTGYPDGTFRPDDDITCAEAVTIINRLLGRDESSTTAKEGTNPFSDLSAGHWAYANILEAAGELVYDRYGIPDQSGHSLPANVTDAYYFVSETEGWAVCDAGADDKIYHTTDGGKTWECICDAFGFDIYSVFFFDSQNGVVVGGSEIFPYFMSITKDGGYTWSNYLSSVIEKQKYLPVSHFPSDASLNESVRAISMRPINQNAVYISVTYISYSGQLEAQKQTVFSKSDLY